MISPTLYHEVAADVAPILAWLPYETVWVLPILMQKPAHLLTNRRTWHTCARALANQKKFATNLAKKKEGDVNPWGAALKASEALNISFDPKSLCSGALEGKGWKYGRNFFPHPSRRFFDLFPIFRFSSLDRLQFLIHSFWNAAALLLRNPSDIDIWTADSCSDPDLSLLFFTPRYYAGNIR